MPSSKNPPPARLDSWKEIAAYLNRQVRTVQRWEVKEGLPVHRHQHDTQVTVFALPGELDEWLASRSPNHENRDMDAVAWPAGKAKALWFGVAALIVVAAVWVSTRAVGARLSFHNRDWVLLAGFENRTGEPLFDGTLQYALERQLTNSRFVSVVPPERIEDALRLMRKPPNTRIDIATARQICLRDGGIRALLTGRAEKFGSTYLFSVQLLNANDGRTVAGAEEQAVGQEQVWVAVRKLSNWVRQSLGEQIAAVPQNERLQQVTTRSLRSLQLYTQALALARTGPRPRQWGASEQLVRQALEYDPEFASSWIWLAWTLRNQRKPVADWKPAAEKAVQLSVNASERERLSILGSYYLFTGEREKSVEAFAALLRLYPDDLNANANLVYVSTAEEQPGLIMSYADLRPNDYHLNLEAARAVFRKDPVKARYFLERARSLTTPETGELFPEEESELQLFPVHESWMKEDAKSGLEELSRLAQSYPQLNPKQREIFARHAGLCYLSFGKLKDAGEWFQKISEKAVTHNLLALAAYAAGDDRRCREEGTNFRQHPAAAFFMGYSSGIALARLGPVPEPDEFLEHYEKLGIDPGLQEHILTHIKGELALSQGRTAEAARLLQEAVDNFRNDEIYYFLPASDGLALAFEQRGRPDRALPVLEEGVRRRFLEFPSDDPYEWDNPYAVFSLRIQARLALVYRQVGRIEDARKLENQLRRILAYADPDHPIVLQLKRLS